MGTYSSRWQITSLRPLSTHYRLIAALAYSEQVALVGRVGLRRGEIQ